MALVLSLSKPLLVWIEELYFHVHFPFSDTCIIDKALIPDDDPAMFSLQAIQ
jgi:hypothetical protein